MQAKEASRASKRLYGTFLMDHARVASQTYDRKQQILMHE
jgi:hypothetical protein